MKISVIGTGYVGLVSGLCLADKGHEVVCVDIDPEKIKMINSKKSPIYEKGLEQLLIKNIGKTFFATTDINSAIMDTELSIIAVGTPFDGDLIDLTYIKQAASDIGSVLRQKTDYHVVVVKSTVVPGTTDDVVLPKLQEASGKKAGTDFGVGMNPEFLREGEAVDDFMNPDRIVIGGLDERSLDVIQKLYEVFEGVDLVRTNNKTAEMIKYTANSLLATLISFSNEIGNMCASLNGVDVVEVMDGVHKDKRFSPILENGIRITPGFISYLAAGCGFGGSCFPKDVKALIAHGKSAGHSMQILESVINTNKYQPNRVIELLNKNFKNLKGRKIAVLGLAFKPGTDDMRESPSIPIVNYLIEAGACINAYDPVAQHEAGKIFGNENIRYMKNLENTLDGADAVILVTSWADFHNVPEILSSMGQSPVFIDGRRLLPKQKFDKYEGIGLS